MSFAALAESLFRTTAWYVFCFASVSLIFFTFSFLSYRIGAYMFVVFVMLLTLFRFALPFRRALKHYG